MNLELFCCSDGMAGGFRRAGIISQRGPADGGGAESGMRRLIFCERHRVGFRLRCRRCAYETSRLARAWVAAWAEIGWHASVDLRLAALAMQAIGEHGRDCPRFEVERELPDGELGGS